MACSWRPAPTRWGIKTRLAELSKNFPSDVSYSVPFDTSIFVKVAISRC